MRALILANGDCPIPTLLKRLRAEADLFIAADGAANKLSAMSIAADVTLGDFDSLDPSTAGALPGHSLVAAPDQNASDLEKAIQFALARGASGIIIAGYAGGRVDHTLVSFALLVKYFRDAEMALVDDLGTVRATDARLEIAGSPGDLVSLVAFAEAQGVVTEGLEWPLHGEALLPGSRGVSNRMIRERAAVQVQSGTLLVCHLTGGAEQ